MREVPDEAIIPLGSMNPYLYGGIALFLLIISSVIYVRPQWIHVIAARFLCECLLILALFTSLLISVNVSVPTATFFSLTFLFTNLVVLNASIRFLFAYSASVLVCIALVFSGTLNNAPRESATGTIVVDSLLIVVAIFLSISLWIAFDVTDRLAFSNARKLDSTWRATESALVAALPRQILPALMDHVVVSNRAAKDENQDVGILDWLGIKNAICDWSGAPATVEDDATIIFVCFPDLSHTVFPESAAEAVAQLSLLWALCDKTATALGVTTLELTNTNFVGVLGLGNEGLRADNAKIVVRVGLAIIAALPPAFAAVVRIGVHSGPAAAGFVGTMRPHFTLVGDVMGTTARLASAARPGGMVVSTTIFARVTDLFESIERTVNLKGKGSMVIFDITREYEEPSASPHPPPPTPMLHASTSIEAKALSSHFTPHTFTFLHGFANKDTESRYIAQPMSPRYNKLLALLLVLTLAFELANNGDQSNFVDCFDRIVANYVALAVAAFLVIAVFCFPRLPAVIRAAQSGFIACMLAMPFFAQQQWSLILSSILLVYTPLDHLTPIRRIALYAIVSVINVILVRMGYYHQNNGALDSPKKFLATAVLFWTFVMNGVAILGTIIIDWRNRSRFAHVEALVAAQDAGAVVLRHLLPRPFFKQLVKGDGKLATHVAVNDDVAVLVANIAGLTALKTTVGPLAAFNLINRAFSEFECAAHATGVYKVKTVGNTIVFSSGLCDFAGPAVGRAARVALLVQLARRIHAAAAHLGGCMRIGIHVGSLVSGIMNSRGLAHDVWGDGILYAMAAEAAAPRGGTAFTAEAAALLSVDDGAGALRPMTSQTGVDASVSRCGHSLTLFCLTESESVLDPTPTTTTLNKMGFNGRNLAAGRGVFKPSGPRSWSFNVWNTDEADLPALALSLLKPSLASGLVDAAAAGVIVAKLCAAHNAVPFHNATHGIHVMLVTTMLARTVLAARTALSEFDIFLLAIAALGSDVGHPGHSNAFEIAASPIAFALAQDDDNPVLERFHSALTTKILLESGALSLLTLTARNDSLHTVTAAIMSTAMSQYDAVVRSLNRCGTLAALTVDALNGALLQAATCSVHVFPRAISIDWSARITAEFANQLANEKMRGLPITHFLIGLEKPLARAQMQAAYLGRVASPLWRALATHAEGSLDEPLANLAGNVLYYASEIERLSYTMEGVFACLPCGNTPSFPVAAVGLDSELGDSIVQGVRPARARTLSYHNMVITTGGSVSSRSVSGSSKLLGSLSGSSTPPESPNLAHLSASAVDINYIEITTSAMKIKH